MKIHELLESTTPFTWIKDLNKEFKDLAADCGLTLVAGMGWPQIVKDGGWFGGGLQQKGGLRKAIDPGELPLETRAKGFIHLLAKRLEELIAAGHTVKVAAGAERGKHMEEVKTGEARQKLTAAFVIGSPPGNVSKVNKMPTAAWFVNVPASLADTMAVRFNFRFQTPDYNHSSSTGKNDPNRINVTVGGGLPIKEAKKFEKDWEAFWKVNNARYARAQGTTMDYSKLLDRTEKGQALLKDLYEYLTKKGIVKLPKTPDFAKENYFGLTLKILTKDTQLIDMPEFVALIRKHI